MRNTVLIAILFIFSVQLQGKNPPGTVEISDGFYCDETETTNLSWREYMHWTKKIYGVESAEFKAVLPDTVVWELQPYVEFYLQHPAYGQYPVVGVSYDQAVAFCKWRTDRVNEKIYIDGHNIDYKPGMEIPDLPKIYEYRLPTKAEWEQIAKADFSKKGQRKFSRKKYSQKEKYNFYTPKPDKKEGKSIYDKEGYFIRRTDKYFPNSFGVYNILGNVAEMIAQKGVAKGGSWTHKADEVSVEKDFEYKKPVKWLGFRCVCERVDQE